MARPRRAKPQRRRVLIPVLVLAVVAAALVGWRLTSDPRPADPVASRSSTPVVAGPTVQTSDSATPSATPSADPAVTEALESCRERVAAGDDVLKAARTGVGHWAEHVQAQTDANEGKVSVAEMDGTFARTRLAGPDDQERWKKARSAYADQDGSCEPVAGATAEQAAALDRCQTRDDAQQPVIEAAVPAMRDWQSHLSAMMRSRMEDVPNAEQVWLKAWRAAPPHIKAFQKAERAFDAPRC